MSKHLNAVTRLDDLIGQSQDQAIEILRNLRTLMKSKGVSLEELCRRTELEVDEVRHWIVNGSAETFDLEALLRIINALQQTLWISAVPWGNSSSIAKVVTKPSFARSAPPSKSWSASEW